MSRLSGPIASIGEFGLIHLISKWVTTAKTGVVHGIGDDAAVVRLRGNGFVLFAIDTIIEDVDFKRGSATAYEIGWKALAVNLSDIAAMGGKPKFAVTSLTLPKNLPINFVKEFYRGMNRLSRRFGVSVVGGDLSRGDKISVSVALIGLCSRTPPVYRSGAKAGDLLCVTGALGGSLLRRHLRFIPRVVEGMFLASSGVSSMIDLSDGLLADLSHLTWEKGLTYELDLARVPVSRDAVTLARGNRKRALQRALSDGEDFELLFTVPRRQWKRLEKRWKRRFRTRLSVIGHVTGGTRRRFAPGEAKGYQHF